MRMISIAALLSLLLAGCSEKVSESASDATGKVADATREAAEKVQDAFEAVGGADERRPNPADLEKERFNAEWRKLQSFREATARKIAQAAKQQPAAPAVSFVNDPKFLEKLKDTPFDNIDKMPVRVPITGDVSGPSVLKTQVLLDRANFSVGALDGRWGKNSAIAVYWFQRENGLPPTGDVDQQTFTALANRGGNAPTLERYTITEDDANGPFKSIPEDVYEKAKLDCLCYESLVEMLAERFHMSIELLEMMNPEVKFTNAAAGTSIRVPNVRKPTPENTNDLAAVHVSVKGWYLHGLDASGNILFHAPTTLGSDYDPSPNETTKLVAIAHDPHFHYQPKLFHEVPDSDPEANLEPGPNSPVGVVWMALSKKHFGIHGTAFPETIGYASSHGCVRLTNWDARDLSHRVQKGLEVRFIDTRGEAGQS